MAEYHVGRNLVNARPSNLAIVLCERSKLLDLLAINPDLRVALHAAGGRSNAHLLTWIGIRMTLAALQFQCPSVHLVAEGNRLLRGRRRLLGSLRGGCQNTSNQEAESQENPQWSVVLHSGAHGCESNKGEIERGSTLQPPAAKAAAKISQSFDPLGKAGQMKKLRAVAFNPWGRAKNVAPVGG